MFKLLIVTEKSSVSGGVSVHTVVVEFGRADDAEAAYTNIKKADRPGDVRIFSVKLY